MTDINILNAPTATALGDSDEYIFGQGGLLKTKVIKYTAYNAVDHGGAVGNDSTDNGTGSALATWIASKSAENFDLVFPPGIYKFSTDYTFPSNVHVVMPEGAKFSGGTVALTGNFTCTWTASGANATWYLGSGYLNTSESMKPAQYVKSATGVIYKIFYFNSPGYSLCTLADAGDVGTQTTGTWKKSPLSLTSTADQRTGDALVHGDYLYLTGTGISGTYATPVAHVTDATTVQVPDYVPYEFTTNTTTQTRGVRIKIQGPFTAGRYQVFTGSESVRFLSVTKVYPEWWGASNLVAWGDTTGYTNNINAINKAQWSFTCQDNAARGVKGTVEFDGGIYYINAPIKWNTSTLIGQVGGASTNSLTMINLGANTNAAAIVEQCAQTPTTGGVATTDSGAIRDIVFDTNDYKTASGLVLSGILSYGGGFDNVVLNKCSWGFENRLGGGLIHIRNCGFMSCLNGMFNQDYEGYITRCSGNLGTRIINPDFASNTSWDTYTGWSFNSTNISHTSGTTALKQSIITNARWASGAYPTPNTTVGVLIAYSNPSETPAGSCTVKVFGVTLTTDGSNPATIDGTVVSGGLILAWMNPRQTGSFTDPWTNPYVIEITPTTDYNGQIDKIHVSCGTMVHGAATQTCDNDFWSDDPYGMVHAGAAVGLYSDSRDGKFYNNAIHPAFISAMDGGWGGEFYGNRLADGAVNFLNHNWNNAEGSSFHDNTLSSGDTNYYHIYTTSNTVGRHHITNNIIKPGDSAETPIKGFFGSTDIANTNFLVENNFGVDKAVTSFPTASGTTPTILGRITTLNNVGATSVTRFLGSANVPGFSFTIIGDGQSTIEFSDGTYLSGNSGVDMLAVSGTAYDFLVKADGKAYLAGAGY